MSLPAIILSLILAGLYAGLFHFAFARRAVDLVYYVPAAIAGFLLGAAVGLLIPLHFLVVGELHVLEGTVTCVAALFLVRWLRSAQG
jgi:hypothetical protein